MGRRGSMSIPGSAEGGVPETSQGFGMALQGKGGSIKLPLLYLILSTSPLSRDRADLLL